MSVGKGLLSSIGTMLRFLPRIDYPTGRRFHSLAKSFQSYCSPLTTTSTMKLELAATPIFKLQKLLTPVNTMLTQIAGFKVNGNIKRRCKDCYIVLRQRRKYVICPTHPRHKQMSMMKRDYKSWILTHATQSKIRPY